MMPSRQTGPLLVPGFTSLREDLLFASSTASSLRGPEGELPGLGWVTAHSHAETQVEEATEWREAAPSRGYRAGSICLCLGPPLSLGGSMAPFLQGGCPESEGARRGWCPQAARKPAPCQRGLGPVRGLSPGARASAGWERRARGARGAGLAYEVGEAGSAPARWALGP